MNYYEKLYVKNWEQYLNEGFKFSEDDVNNWVNKETGTLDLIYGDNYIDVFKNEFYQFFTEEFWNMLENLEKRNTYSSYCNKCFWSGEPELSNIQILEQSDECPNCGNEELEEMNYDGKEELECTGCFSTIYYPEEWDDDVECPNCGKRNVIDETDEWDELEEEEEEDY